MPPLGRLASRNTVVCCSMVKGCPASSPVIRTVTGTAVSDVTSVVNWARSTASVSVFSRFWIWASSAVSSSGFFMDCCACEARNASSTRVSCCSASAALVVSAMRVCAVVMSVVVAGAIPSAVRISSPECTMPAMLSRATSMDSATIGVPVVPRTSTDCMVMVPLSLRFPIMMGR